MPAPRDRTHPRKRRSSTGVAHGSRGAQGLAGPSRPRVNRGQRQARHAQVPVRTARGTIVRRPRTPQQKGPVLPHRAPKPRRRTTLTQSLGAQGRRQTRNPARAQTAANRRRDRLQKRYRPTFREPNVPLVAPGNVSPRHYQRIQRATVAAYARAGRRQGVPVSARERAALKANAGNKRLTNNFYARKYLEHLQRNHAPWRYTLPMQVNRAQQALDARRSTGRAVGGRPSQPHGFGAGASKYTGLSAFSNRYQSQLGATGSNARLLSVPVEAIRANVEGGPKTIGRTLTGFGQFAVGAIAGPIQLGYDTVAGTIHGDPLRAGRKMVKTAKEDYSRRYGPLVHGDVEGFRKRLRDEGTAAEMVDVATFVAPEVGILGRGLGAVAREGAIGKWAHRTVSAPRPHLRTSGTAFRAQELSPNFFRAVGQRGEDRLRQATLNRRNRKAAKRGQGKPGLQPFDRSPEVQRHLDAQEHHLREMDRAHRNGNQAAVRFHKARAAQATRALDRRLMREERRRTPSSVVAASLWGQRRLQRIEGSKGQSRRFNALKRQQQDDVTLGVETDLARVAKGRGGSTRLAASWFVLKGIVSLEHPEFAGRQLIRRRRMIEDQPGSRAEVAAIDAVLHAGPEKVFSHPSMREFHANALERGLRLDEENVRVKDSTAEAQRYRAQGHMLGVEHPYEQLRREFEDGTHAERAKHAKTLERAATEYLKRAERELHDAEKREAVVRGRTGERVRVSDLAARRRNPEYVAVAQSVASARREVGAARKAMRNAARLPGRYTLEEEAAIRARLQNANARLSAGHEVLRDIRRDMDNYPDAGTRPRGDLAGLERHAATVQLFERRVQKAKADLKEAKALRQSVERAGSKRARADLERAKPEHDAEFVRRVRLAAEHVDERLPDPVYVKDYPVTNEGREILGEYNIGGSRAMGGVKESRLSLFAKGEADVSPRAYVRSTLEQIKGRHNWGLVADQVEQATIHVTPDDLAAALGREDQLAKMREHGAERGLSAEQVERRFLENTSLYDWHRYLYAKNLDPADYAFWNPGRARHEIDSPDEGLRPLGERDRTRDDLEEPTADLDRAVTQGGVEGLNRKAMEWQADRHGDVFHKTKGWLMLPREAYNEITASAKGSGLGGRIVEKVMGLQSRVLLGYNPTWPMAQVAANVFQAMFAIGPNIANPVFWARTMRWYRSLPAETRRAIVDEWGSGIGSVHGRKTHIGGAANNAFVRSIRAKRELATEWMRMRKQAIPGARHVPGNIADAMFAFDDVQNLFFRKGVLYAQTKRQAYRDMSRKMGAADRAMRQVEDIVTISEPRARMEALLRNPHQVERAFQHVDDFMGNWSRYTARERRTLKRFVLFYGFLRFSLRTAFYTLPVKHPIMASIVGKLGQLHVEEVKDLLGGDSAPWAYGRIFFTKDGKLSSVDLARINPITNPLINAVSQGPKALGAPLFSPVVQATLDQMYAQSMFTGRGFRVGGSTQEANNPGIGPRANIFFDQILQAAWPYRVAEKVTQSGTQADDSTLWNPQQVNYAPYGEAAIRELEKRSREGTWQARLVQQVLPFFVPKPDFSREQVAARKEAAGGGGGGEQVVVRGSGRVSDAVPSGAIPSGAVPGSVKVSP